MLIKLTHHIWNYNEEKKNIRSELTFGDMVKTFMERYSKLHKKTWLSDERDIPRFLSFWFPRKLSHISKQEVQTLHEKVGKENGQGNKLKTKLKATHVLNMLVITT